MAADLDAAQGRLRLLAAWLADRPVDHPVEVACLISQNLPDVFAELRAARAVISSAAIASTAVEQLVNQLAKDRATWDDDAIAMWDATQVLQQDLSLYRRAVPDPRQPTTRR